MITLGKLTGKVKDDLYIQVALEFRVTRWVKPVFSFPFMGLPTQKWVDKYKNAFAAVVAYQDGTPDKLLMLGVLPMTEGKIPEETLNGNTFILTEKFRVWIDDNANKLIIDTLDKGEIYFGKDAKEPVLLGDKTEDALNKIEATLKDIVTLLGNIATADTPAVVAANLLGIPLTYPTVINAKLPDLTTSLVEVTTAISKIKSDKVKTI